MSDTEVDNAHGDEQMLAGLIKEVKLNELKKVLHNLLRKLHQLGKFLTKVVTRPMICISSSIAIPL